MQVGADLDDASLRAAAASVVIEGIEVHVAAVDQLILMKEEAARPKDLQTLPILRWLGDRTLPEP